MNVFFPFHPGDYVRSLDWMRWNAELGGTRRHSLFLHPAKKMRADDYAELVRVASESWAAVEIVPDYEGLDGWPAAPNACIRQACTFFYMRGTKGKREPWVFWENDAIPLVPEWLDRLEAEYRTAGKPFMGAMVFPGGDTPIHCTGNAVYPWDAMIRAGSLMIPRHSHGSELAFDIAAADQIVPQMHDTKLIQHVFWMRGNDAVQNNAPQEVPTFPDQASLSILSPDAVVFHRVKDGSLVRQLQLKKGCPPGAVINPEWERLGPECDVHLHPDVFVALPDKPRVHTYFSPVESSEGRAEQEKLLALWRQTWSAHGWEPVVLTEDDARKCPGFEALKAQFSKFPTVNPPGYEMACWLRYVAMSETEHRGFLTDYDVINFGFTRGDVDHRKALSDYPIPLAAHAPCVLYGHYLDYRRAVDEFRRSTERFTERGQPHVSDMHLIQAWKWPTLDICKEYGSPGWETAKLVHFGHYSTDFKRSDTIERALTMGRGEPAPEAPRIELSERKLPTSLVGQLRALCEAQKELVANLPGRRTMLHTELRKAGLLGRPLKKFQKSKKKLPKLPAFVRGKK